MLLKLDGTKYVRVAPEEARHLDCDPLRAAKVTGPLVDRANLDANRIAQPG